MNLKSCMVPVKEVRHYVDSRKLVAKMIGFLNFITTFLCLLMDAVDMPSGIRIHLNQEHGTSSPGTRVSLPTPAFFSFSH